MNIDLIPDRRQSARKHQRRHRGAGRRRAGEVRVRQEVGRLVRRPHPAHADALSGELRLRAAHALARRRPARCAGDRPLAVHPGLRRPRAADRRPQPRGRAWRRREADLRAGRHDLPLLFATSASGRTCRRSCSSRSSISSPTTRTWSPTSGSASASGAMPPRPARIVIEAIERAEANAGRRSGTRD